MTKRKATVMALLMAATFMKAPALRADDPQEAYDLILEQVGHELALPFTDPDDPGLYERRQRLKGLFAAVPPQFAHTLRERLGDEPTGDALSQQFHHTLHEATIAELLGILDAIPAPTPAPTPVATPTPPLVWPTMPLPASAEPRYQAALAKLEKLVDASGDARAWRYKCWIAKLRLPSVDDRVISWSAICPIGGATGAAYIVGPCDVGTGLSLNEQTALWQEIQGVPDVDAAAERHSLFKHMKADILVNEELTASALDSLRSSHDGVIRALEQLDKWANNPAGGSSAMPRAYVSIKDWIGAKQSDSNSLYSCH